MLDLSKLRYGRLDRAHDIALEHEVEVLDRPGLHLLEESFDRHAPRRLSKLFAAKPLAARVRELACAPLVLDHPAQLAGRRRLVEPEDLDGLAGPGLLDLVTAEVVERPDLSPGVPGDDGVSDAERAAMHQHGCDRAAADVEL